VGTTTASTGGGDATALLNIHGRNARRVIRDHIAYDYDEATGALIRTIPLFFRGKAARVFDPNPVASQNDPSLRDANDAATAVPAAAYRAIELLDVAASGPLRGPNVSLVDREPPNRQPPDVMGFLTFDREADGFEDVNAYFHIDRNQRYLQSLGYTGVRSVAAYPIEVDAHAQNGSDSSFFLPSLIELGRGTLVFGEGGTDDAEDADLLIHEYGHAILEWIAPGTFGGPFAGQPRGLAEGFCDYWAYSQHVATRLASGRDPFCFADWDARCADDDPSQQCAYPPGTDCLRRLDSTRTMADYDSREQSGTEHRNGAIWSSALREIHERVGKTVADTVVLESIFDMPAVPSYAAAAHRLVEADQQLYGGAHVAVICAAMTARGITMDCAFTPRGELTHFQSSDHGVTIPDNQGSGVTSSLTVSDARVVEELFVRVDIDHSSRGDLRIELIAPDGTSVLLKQASPDGGGDVRTTYGLTSTPAQPLTGFRGRSAQGVWQLRITDLRRLDVGTLRSWDLVLKFEDSVRLAARPRVGRTQMIPVVGHLFGIGGTEFVSDVRVANPSASSTTATLLFTRSGDDGGASFFAIDVALAAGQTVALDDVVSTAFLTAGSGSLEVLGDVIVTSRTYALTTSGTMGQQVPANLDTTSREEQPIYAAAFPRPGFRLNLGLTEVGGGTGIVRAGTREYVIAPFSHVQFAHESALAKITVVSGDARVSAYLSQVDNASGDAMFLPAVRQRPLRIVMAPALSATGANGVTWRSDFWSVVPKPPLPVLPNFVYWTGNARESTFLPGPQIDVVGTAFGRPGTVGAIYSILSSEMLAFTRIATDGMSQFVPFMDVDGPSEQQLLFIESGAVFRTNIGFVGDQEALAEVVIYDSSGAEAERLLLATEGGVAQGPVRAAVTGGRAVVRFLKGRGRAYASLVDNGTGDATFIEGQ
jgi:subtilisin-like proprotein convertase family protein